MNEILCQIADEVEPRYRAEGRSYSCGGHVAKIWGAAYSGAEKALEGRLEIIHSAAAFDQEPVAVIRFDKTTRGNENEMPKVISCNWQPDGEYRVFLHSLGSVDRDVVLEEIIRDVCELPGDEDPDADDTLILSVDALRVILERNLAAQPAIKS